MNVQGRTHSVRLQGKMWHIEKSHFFHHDANGEKRLLLQQGSLALHDLTAGPLQ